MLELVFLLLPVAAGYGYVMGRNSLRQAQRKQSKLLSRHYFKGLNFLLSDQPDKAVDSLIKMINLDNDTIETHIAMGNFFRHRGELDRAIRVHQNLIDRDEIDPEHKEQALKELGRDYMLAGFLERAEGAYLQLLESDKYYLDAQQQLFNIYQTTKEWGKAIELAERMMKCRSENEELCQRLSHFYCEKSALLIANQEIEAAESLLEKAVMIDGHAVRPWLMLGELSIQNQQYKQATEYLFEVPKRDAEWLSEVISSLEHCAEYIGDWSEYESKLDEHWHSCASAYLSKARLIASKESIEAASQYLADQLKSHPTMKGFDVLLSFYMEQHAGDDVAASLGNLHSLIENQLGQRPKYRCGNCGFSGKKVHWLCPSCKNWGVIKPIVGLDGE